MKWKYLIVGNQLKSVYEEEEFYCDLGMGGWELVTVVNNRSYFKKLDISGTEADKAEKIKNAIIYLMSHDVWKKK